MTSKTIGSSRGFCSVMSKAVAFLMTEFIVMTSSAFGLSVFTKIVYQKYSPVCSSVKVIEPVYCPESTG